MIESNLEFYKNLSAGTAKSSLQMTYLYTGNSLLEWQYS